jgi:hypothetical protein
MLDCLPAAQASIVKDVKSVRDIAETISKAILETEAPPALSIA